MPVPKPRKGEQKDEFISRCMKNDAMQEYDQKQRAAICYSTWREKGKKKGICPECIKRMMEALKHEKV